METNPLMVVSGVRNSWLSHADELVFQMVDLF